MQADVCLLAIQSKVMLHELLNLSIWMIQLLSAFDGLQVFSDCGRFSK